MNYKILIFILTIYCCISCKTTENKKLNNYVILSGKIVNQVNNFKIGSFDNSVNHELKIDKEGNFNDTLYLDAGIYTLTDKVSRVNIQIEKGANITVNGDAKDFYNTISFSGSSQGVNNYLISKRKLQNQLTGNRTEYYKLNEKDYKSKANDHKQSLLKLLNSSEQVSNEFKKKEKRNLHYEYLFELTDYGMLHRYYADIENFKPSEIFLEELSAMVYDNEVDYDFSNHYAKLVYRHYRQIADSLMKNDIEGWDLAEIKTFGNIKNNYIKNALLLKCGLNKLGNNSDVQGFYNEFMRLSTNETHKEQITERYARFKRIESGQPAPKFDNYENYNGGTTSLEDFKGKYVYIDVWATWCTSCIAVMPDLAEVEEKYHGKNIEFVSISLDKPSHYEKWRKMVADKELGGTQLIIDKDDASRFSSDYFIFGIPRFILIDPEGNLVKASAPGPNRMQLIELFNSLNI